MKRLTLSLLCSALLLPTVSYAQDASAPSGSEAPFGIVAVVGDSVISSLDLVERMALVFGTTGIADTPETRQKIVPQLVKQMIDEQLQAQEAKRKKVTITDSDVEKAIGSIEEQNNKGSGTLIPELEKRGLPVRAFQQQIRAQLAWSKLLADVVRPRVRLSEAEMQRAANAKPSAAGGEEVSITPLVLNVEKADQEQQLAELAQKIVTEVKGGASLSAVAQQLANVPPGAAPNFWVSPDQLEPELAAQLRGAKKGDIIGPVRTKKGYQIVQVNARRDKAQAATQGATQVVAKDVLLALDADSGPKDVQMTMDIAAEVAKNPGSCTDASVADVSNLSASDIKVDFIRAEMSTLPGYAQEQLSALSVGEVGDPFATPEGIHFYILCERVDMPAKAVKAEVTDELRDRLFREKMELEATKLMRDLRRSTFIDVRL